MAKPSKKELKEGFNVLATYFAAFVLVAVALLTISFADVWLGWIASHFQRP